MTNKRKIGLEALKSFHKDDDGVALAFCVCTFLFLFMLAMSVYAVGETVRQKIELQNAADAAAYSAAITQADTISRVAAINRSMSWTYVQMTRKQMDYIVDKWLERVLLIWDIKNRFAVAYHAPSSCNNARAPHTLWVGASPIQDYTVTLNSKTVRVDLIRKARQEAAAEGKSYGKLGSEITNAKNAIVAMNEAEVDLLANLNSRINDVVEEVVKANLSESDNDVIAGGADIHWKVLKSDDPENYFRYLKNDAIDEGRFLEHGGYDPSPMEVFENGIDVWFVRKDADDGIQRHYSQGGSLLATFSWYTSYWKLIKVVCVQMGAMQGIETIKGEDVKDGQFEGERAMPKVLTEDFFDQEGTIAVGVARKYVNPLAFVTDDKNDGLFAAFSFPDDDKRSMTAISAARAGYREPGGSTGEYNTSFSQPLPKERKWNLLSSDWDAVLLPVKRAWSSALNGKYQGDSGDQLMRETLSALDVKHEAPAGFGEAGGHFKPENDFIHH